MLPETIDIDRTLPESAAVKPALGEYARTTLGEDVVVTRLHRVFYPVFRVTFQYESGRLSIRSNTETEHVLVDGLWADNHEHLQTYVDGTDEPIEVLLESYDFAHERDEFGESIVLDFQVPLEEARDLLPSRIADLEASREANDPSSVRSRFETRLLDEFDLPDAFETKGFEDVTNIRPLYLPFWIAQLSRPSASDASKESMESDQLVANRTVEEASDPADSHAWLASFFEADPARLAHYAHPFQLSPEAEGAVTVSDEQSPDTDETTRPDHAVPDGMDAGREIVQPDGVEMDAETLVQPRPTRSFADVGGMAALERTIRKTVIDPVERAEQFAEYGLDPVSGVLLHGPPGCGKTYIAGAIAGELGWGYLSLTPADIMSKYMGQPATNVQEAFAIAAANAPCVVFLDEIDAIAGGREDQSSTSERGMVNQLLSELEEVPEDVLVLAATNRLEDVDEAIIRTGRFDERIEVPPPDGTARWEILEIHLEERPVAEDLSLMPVVDLTAGYAASDLVSIADEAARQALRTGEQIDESHLLAAAEEIESSVPDWAGAALAAGKTIEQPDGVSLNARTLATVDTGVDFDDVGGMEELKDVLERRVIEPIESREAYEEYGIDPTGGVMLYGPPGCGKTYLAEALAGELDWIFLDVTPADITSKWMGKPAQNVADLFAIARANEPALVFLDEIDGLAGSRAGSSGEPSSQRQLVNQLLTELDGVDDGDAEVVVLAATNLVDAVDDAILRSGRFDERIEVGPPDEVARREILRVHLADRPVDPTDSIDWETIGEATAGFAASDLALLAENAARRAVRVDEPVTQSHLEAAISETRSSLDGWNGGGGEGDTGDGDIGSGDVERSESRQESASRPRWYD